MGFAGYILKILGGQDKQGFAMKQGVLTQDRVKLMMSKGVQGCRGYGMRKGERYRKSVRGCIISRHISVLHLVIVKKGPAEIPGLTDESIPRRLGPKRASKIRKRDTLRFKKTRQAKAKSEAADYQKLLAQRQKEVRDKKMEKISQRKSARSSRASEE